MGHQQSTDNDSNYSDDVRSVKVEARPAVAGFVQAPQIFQAPTALPMYGGSQQFYQTVQPQFVGNQLALQPLGPGCFAAPRQAIVGGARGVARSFGWTPSPGVTMGPLPIPMVSNSYPQYAGQTQYPAYLTPMRGPLVAYARDQVSLENVDSDSKWFTDIIKQFWPHICIYIGDILKQTFVKLALSMRSSWGLHIFKDIDAFVARLTGHCITFPLKVSWINAIIADVWSFAQPIVQTCVDEYVLPMIRDKLPKQLRGIDINPCKIGTSPPRINSMVVDRRKQLTTSGHLDNLHLVVEVEWRSELDINLRLPVVLADVGIKGARIKSKMHITMVEMLNRPPFFGGLSVYMSNAPRVDFDFTGALDLLDSDIVQNLIDENITSIVNNMVVLPHRIGVPMDPEMDIFRLICPRPRGMLKVTVLRATGLRADDMNLQALFNGKRSCEPYVAGVLGSSTIRTKTAPTAVASDASHGADSQWDEDLYFLVDEPYDQRFSFTVFDDDQFSGDEPLARLQYLSCWDLLGMTQEAFDDGWRPQAFQFRKKYTMEVLWAEKVAEETQTKSAQFDTKVRESAAGMVRSETRASDTSDGFVGKMVSAARKATESVVGEVKSLQNEVMEDWKKHTGASLKDIKKLRSTIELVATWRPLELNTAFAKSLRPGMALPEKVSCLLFVGIRKCSGLPLDKSAPDATKFFVQVECLPCVTSAGVDVSTSSVDSKKLSSPIARTPPSVAVQKDDKQKNLETKIVLLVKQGVPNETIATVLDITVAQIESFLQKAIVDETADDATVNFNEGFNFLVVDPHVSVVNIEIFKGKNESVGKFVYSAATLLACSNLTDDMEKRPLLSATPGPLIDLRMQLRTFNMGKDFPGGGYDDFSKKKPHEEKVETKPKAIYYDKLGRTKVQIDGMWVDDDGEAAQKAGGKGIVDKAKDALKGGLEKAKDALHSAEDAAKALLFGKNVGEPEADDKNRIYVKVIKAKGLTNLDGVMSGKSDPYCLCTLKGKDKTSKFKTKVINNDLNPRWDHTGELVMFSPGDIVKVEVWDKDTFPAPDNIIGSVEIPSSAFYPSGFGGDLTLKDPKGKPAGTISIKVLLPLSLSVTVISASNLPNLDGCLAGTSDPYVFVSLAGKKKSRFKTHVVENEENPVWDHTGTLFAYTPGDTLRLEVWDQDTNPKPDQFIGGVEITSDKFLQSGMEAELALSDQKGKRAKGSLKFRVMPPVFQPLEQGKPLIQEILDEPLQEGNADDRHRLYVHVKKAEDLTNMDGFMAGTSDPYCVCLIPGREKISTFKTKVISNSENPEWDHFGELRAFMPGDTLTLEIWDEDMMPMPDQLIGAVTVPSESFYPNGFEGTMPLADKDGKHGGEITVAIHVPRKLVVTIISARNLPSMDGFLAGKSDPFVVCSIPGKKMSRFQTKVIDNNNDPTWDHTGVINAHTVGDKLLFEVWDQDTFPKPNDLIGAAELPAEKVQVGFDGELPIVDKAGKSAGTLRIRTEPPILEAPPPPPEFEAAPLSEDLPVKAGSSESTAAPVSPSTPELESNKSHELAHEHVVDPELAREPQGALARDWRPRPRQPSLGDAAAPVAAEDGQPRPAPAPTSFFGKLLSRVPGLRTAPPTETAPPAQPQPMPTGVVRSPSPMPAAVVRTSSPMPAGAVTQAQAPIPSGPPPTQSFVRPLPRLPVPRLSQGAHPSAPSPGGAYTNGCGRGGAYSNGQASSQFVAGRVASIKPLPPARGMFPQPVPTRPMAPQLFGGVVSGLSPPTTPLKGFVNNGKGIGKQFPRSVSTASTEADSFKISHAEGYKQSMMKHFEGVPEESSSG